jgi:hypothetical protein
MNDLRKATQLQNANGNLSTDFRVILEYFSPLLNVHGVSDVRHIEIHATGASVSVPTSTETQTAIQMLKSHNSTGTD